MPCSWCQPHLLLLPLGTEQARSTSLANGALSGQAESLLQLPVGFFPHLVPLILVFGLSSALWVCGVRLSSLSEPVTPPLSPFCDLWWVLAPGLFEPGLSSPLAVEVLTFLLFVPCPGEGKSQ